jgi:putative ABC transport system permease protein
VVKDIKDRSLTENAQPYFYVPFRQVYREDMNLFVFVRTAGNPLQAVPLLRKEVREVDPNVIIFEAIPMTEYIGASWFAQKIAASMLSILGALAMLLAALGLYSVMSYSVTQRTREIGVRMAVGAQRAEILALLLRRGMVLTSAGLLAGAGLMLVLSRTALASSGSFLGRSGGESLIYLTAAVFLAFIAAVATYIPARRATRVDPMVALRYE